MARRTVLRQALALLDADLRRRRNRIPGYRRLPDRTRALALTAAVVAVATVVAAAWGISTALGRGLPVRATSSEAVGGICWAAAVALMAGGAASARPAGARLLLDPMDRELLLQWRVPPAAVLLARLWLPAFAGAAGTALGASLLAGPWLAASAAGRRLLPSVLVVLTGAALAAALLHICGTALLMRRPPPAAAGRLRPAAVAGSLLLGLALAPVLSRPGGAGGPGAADTTEHLAVRLRQGIAHLRPHLWDWLLAPGHPERPAAAWCAAVLALAGLACLLLRRVARGGGPVPAAHPSAADRRGAPLASRLADTPALLLLPLKDVLSLDRRPDSTTGALRRTRLLGAALIAFGLGARLRGAGGPPWSRPTEDWSVPLALTVVLALSTAVTQVAGVEAEQRSLDLLRQAPVPFGRVLAGKILSCAAVAAAPVAPCYLGLLLALGGPVTPTALLALPVSLLAGGCAMVAAAFLVPPAESFADGRTGRSGAAETVEGLIAAVLVAPAAAGPLLRRTLAPGTSVDTVATLFNLVLIVLGLRLLVGRDPRIRKVHL